MRSMYKLAAAVGLACALAAGTAPAALAAESDFTGDEMTGTADKYYEVSGVDSYADSSAVKLTWSVPVVTYTSTTNRAWNTQTLRWEKSVSASTTGTGVSFELANRGSVEVKAEASFTPDAALADGAATVEFDGNGAKIPSIVDPGTHALKNKGTDTSSEDYVKANCTGTIEGTVSPDWDKLGDATTATKLGTYTVTISDPNAKAVAATFSLDGEVAELTWDELKEEANGTKYGYTASAISDDAVGNYAFRGCSSLTSINIPDGVTEIGGYAFSGCRSLEGVTIPDGVEAIYLGTFCACESLKSITLPDSVTYIGESAFSSCTLLENVTIPDSVTEIDQFAFQFCESLESITIPKKVTSIGYGAFLNCTLLKSLTYAGAVEQWNNITKGDNWSLDIAATEVICADGTVNL